MASEHIGFGSLSPAQASNANMSGKHEIEASSDIKSNNPMSKLTHFPNMNMRCSRLFSFPLSDNYCVWTEIEAATLRFSCMLASATHSGLTTKRAGRETPQMGREATITQTVPQTNGSFSSACHSLWPHNQSLQP